MDSKNEVPEGNVRLRLKRTSLTNYTDIDVNAESIIQHYFQDGYVFTLTAEASEDLLEEEVEETIEEIKARLKKTSEEKRIVKNGWEE